MSRKAIGIDVSGIGRKQNLFPSNGNEGWCLSDEAGCRIFLKDIPLSKYAASHKELRVALEP